MLRQRTINRNTYTWNNGPLNDLNISVLDANRVGLEACQYLGLIAGVSSERTAGHGVRLFVATSNDTFEQLSWYPGMSSWIVERRWSGMNGHASPTCFGWGKGHTFYTWFVNAANTIEMWWYVNYTTNIVQCQRSTNRDSEGSIQQTKRARQRIRSMSGQNVRATYPPRACSPVDEVIC